MKHHGDNWYSFTDDDSPGSLLVGPSKRDNDYLAFLCIGSRVILIVSPRGDILISENFMIYIIDNPNVDGRSSNNRHTWVKIDV